MVGRHTNRVSRASYKGLKKIPIKPTRNASKQNSTEAIPNISLTEVNEANEATSISKSEIELCLREKAGSSSGSSAKVSGSAGSDRRDQFVAELCEDFMSREEKVRVDVRIVFLKIGEIETTKEQFAAEAFIEAKWKEPSILIEVSLLGPGLN